MSHDYGPEDYAGFSVFSGGVSQAKCTCCGALRVVRTHTWFENYEQRTYYVQDGFARSEELPCSGVAQPGSVLGS